MPFDDIRFLQNLHEVVSKALGEVIIMGVVDTEL
jgi:hypothetical protein